ncbi:hypothetical protein [Rhodococcus rhodochrous]|uniref:hypothetical protein n=1 Tax=Rhodococcus rhodochrous TaxID=1829 RepID=UPI0013520B2E|nr:hypothetical protein [Rhodococcus rhodochrous]
MEFAGVPNGYAKTVSANEHLQGSRSGAGGEQVSVLLIADPGEPAALAVTALAEIPQ